MLKKAITLIEGFLFAILIALIGFSSCQAQAQPEHSFTSNLPDTCPGSWRQSSDLRMQRSAEAYVSFVRGGASYTAATLVAERMEQLQAHYNHCGPADEAQLVNTVLSETRQAIQSYHNNGFTTVTNGHLDRAFNARNQLTTKFNW